MLTVALVEDEPLARLRTKDFLAEIAKVRTVGEAATVEEARRLLHGERPDVAIIDIELPDGSGLDLAASLPSDVTPVVIFLTAYDHYAARAFDVAAVDYLLKPVRRERLHAAITRAREQLLPREITGNAPRPSRIAVPTDDATVILVPVSEIDYIESAGNYVRLHWSGRHQLVREGIGSIESRLDPHQFVRIHRTVIANLDRIDHFEPSTFGDYHVTLTCGAVVPLSRRYRHRIPLLAGHL